MLPSLSVIYKTGSAHKKTDLDARLKSSMGSLTLTPLSLTMVLSLEKFLWLIYINPKNINNKNKIIA